MQQPSSWVKRVLPEAWSIQVAIRRGQLLTISRNFLSPEVISAVRVTPQRPLPHPISPRAAPWLALTGWDMIYSWNGNME